MSQKQWHYFHSAWFPYISASLMEWLCTVQLWESWGLGHQWLISGFHFIVVVCLSSMQCSSQWVTPYWHTENNESNVTPRGPHFVHICGLKDFLWFLLLMQYFHYCSLCSFFLASVQFGRAAACWWETCPEAKKSSLLPWCLVLLYFHGQVIQAAINIYGFDSSAANDDQLDKFHYGPALFSLYPS